MSCVPFVPSGAEHADFVRKKTRPSRPRGDMGCVRHIESRTGRHLTPASPARAPKNRTNLGEKVCLPRIHQNDKTSCVRFVAPLSPFRRSCGGWNPPYREPNLPA